MIWFGFKRPLTVPRGKALARWRSEGDYPAELLDLVRWMLDTNAAATWDLDSDDLHKAAEQLVGMLAPVMDDAEEVVRRINAWAEEWSFR